MITDIGVLPALEESRSTMTKSSITPENASTALAKMAGASSGSITRRMAASRLAPRSAAASSYWRPNPTSRAPTMIAGPARASGICGICGIRDLNIPLGQG